MKVILSLIPAILSLAVCHSQSSAAQKPNILIIYADDLGYGDVSCYNPDRGRIPTPHIDQLAGQGMRFTDGRSTPGAPQKNDVEVRRFPR